MKQNIYITDDNSQEKVQYKSKRPLILMLTVIIYF